MRTHLPDLSRAQLERRALEHAIGMSVACGRPFEASNSDRLVVNMLRHEFTDYDDDQSALAHKAACDAIKAAYPWLEAECDAQAARRKATDAFDAASIEMAEATERRRRTWRHDRVQQSRAAIVELSVGASVTARVDGRERTGTITWRGRSRVEVAYTTKAGEGRVRRIYARDVSLVVSL